jgi:signal transduction histidine kinase
VANKRNRQRVPDRRWEQDHADDGQSSQADTAKPSSLQRIHNKVFDKESIDKFLRTVEKIGSEVDVEEIKGSINATVIGSNRIKEIVANLRTFTGHHVEDIVETNIAAHLNHAINLFFNQYQNIQFQKEFLSQRTVDVRVQEISQCFINILTNAVQAIRDAEKNRIVEAGKGRIHIRTENASFQNEEAVKITINDNGIGIPSDVVSKIFEPFFTTRLVGHGRGLGLSEVYAIIKHHQGHIDIRSEENRGTTVEMILLCMHKGKDI